MAWTSFVGPPISVVPVSMADSAVLAVIGTDFPCTVTEFKVNSQKLGFAGMFRKSMSPVNRLELVPPRVNTPPGSSSVAVGSLPNRVSQKDISGELNWPLLARASQKGVDWVEEIVEKARPMIPEILSSSNSDETALAINNVCAGTTNPAIDVISAPIWPFTWPDPYWMLVVCWDSCSEVDCDGWKTGVLLVQPWQFAPATHKSEEPVSNTTSNDWAGVPMFTVPM